MDVHYHSHHTPVMETPELELAQFQIETSKRIIAWSHELIAHPERLDELDHNIDQYYRNAAGRIVATILYKASKHESIDERLDDVRENAGTPLRNPVKQNVVTVYFLKWSFFDLAV